MIFDICKNMKTAARKGFGEGFSNGINAPSLGTAYYPREVVFFRQLSYLQALWLISLGY
jgi:hypothetical protein